MFLPRGTAGNSLKAEFAAGGRETMGRYHLPRLWGTGFTPYSQQNHTSEV